jgi:hypothetical protein
MKLSVPAEAIAAVNRPVVLRHERYLRRFSALCAHGVMHFTILALARPSAVIALALTGVPAVLAAHRLVRKALFGKELLITRGKNKLFTAVPANQYFILIHYDCLPFMGLRLKRAPQ